MIHEVPICLTEGTSVVVMTGMSSVAVELLLLVISGLPSHNTRSLVMATNGNYFRGFAEEWILSNNSLRSRGPNI